MIAKEEDTKADNTTTRTMTTTEKKDTNNKEEENHAYDTTTTTTTTRKRHGARNQHRHKFFVKWIIEKFPDAVRQAKDDDSANDNRHCHVLDIAGGKGELSARLTICHCLFVQMVDPRPANLYDCFYKNVYRSLPKKWQEKISTSRCSDKDHPDKIQTTLDARFHQFVKSFPCDGGIDVEEDEKNGCKIPSAVVVQLQQDAELVQAVKNCTLMIGMHADGATEAIVDIALYYRKPFVVVPCCVFPNLFQHRMVPRIRREKVNNNEDNDLEEDNQTISEPEEMTPVRTHEQFCRYLAMKDSHFVMETLPFEGRNIGI